MFTSLIQATPQGSWGLQPEGSSMLRYAPEPHSTLGKWVQAATSTVANMATTALTGNPMLDSAADFQQLIQTQIQVQRDMQIYTMVSNLERSKHETEMAPVRNMRVG
jgi:hypothetical protein